MLQSSRQTLDKLGIHLKTTLFDFISSCLSISPGRNSLMNHLQVNLSLSHFWGNHAFDILRNNNKYAHRNTMLGNGECSLQFWECKSKMKFKCINDLFYSSTTNLFCFFQSFFHDGTVTEIHQSKSQCYSHYHRLVFNLMFGDVHYSSLQIACTLSRKLYIYI